MVAGKETKAKPPPKAAGKAGKDEKSVDDSVNEDSFQTFSKILFKQKDFFLKFEPIKVDARLANTAVLMLDSPEEDVLQKACESIFKFCEKSKNILNRKIMPRCPTLFVNVT